MYKCMHCGQDVSNCDVELITIDPKAWFNRYEARCPYCGSNDLESETECCECGEWFVPEHGWEEMCPECFEQYVKDIDVLTEFGYSTASDDGINSLYLKAFSPDEINEILRKEFEGLPIEKQTEIMRNFATDDPQSYVWFIRGES